MTNVIMLDTLQENDKKAIGNLLVESYSQFQNTYEERQDWLDYARDLKSSVNNPLVDRFLVARDGEEILGTLQLFTNSGTAYNNPKLEILSPIIRMLAVSPASRGKGIAQALLKESINYAREKVLIVFIYIRLIKCPKQSAYISGLVLNVIDQKSFTN